MDPLYPNPGGPVDPDDFVGRTDELKRLIEAVSRGGAHVTGERRMGKTALLAKLEDELTNAGRIVVRISAETSSLRVFEDRLLAQLRKHRLVSERLSTWEKEVGGEVKVGVGSTGLVLRGSAKSPTREPVEMDLLDLLTAGTSATGSVLVLDEITVLCQGLGPAAATEFLGTLRARRQGAEPVALVIAGSIGLHHALPDTRPINDLWRVEVGALTDAEARLLTRRLLLGIGLEPSPERVAAIVTATSGIPFYIQAVTDRMRQGNAEAADDVDALIEQCIHDNDWHTEHYVTRIEEYYGTEAAPLVRAILDEFSLAGETGLSVDEVTRLVATTTGEVVTRDRLLDLLGKLEKDHYLTRRGNRDAMSSPLLARIWRIHRRLDPRSA